MRAFMSERHDENDEAERYPNFALREARAILEANEGGSLHYLAGSYPALSELTADERAALTEALSAFVAEPVETHRKWTIHTRGDF